jgi:hypothetical protein
MMTYFTLLATVEICNFWGCTWLENAVTYLQTLVSNVVA